MRLAGALPSADKGVFTAVGECATLRNTIEELPGRTPRSHCSFLCVDTWPAGLLSNQFERGNVAFVDMFPRLTATAWRFDFRICFFVLAGRVVLCLCLVWGFGRRGTTACLPERRLCFDKREDSCCCSSRVLYTGDVAGEGRQGVGNCNKAHPSCPSRKR